MSPRIPDRGDRLAQRADDELGAVIDRPLIDFQEILGASSGGRETQKRRNTEDGKILVAHR